MPVTLNSTGITFSDGSSQSTAVTQVSVGAATYTSYTSYYAPGGYFVFTNLPIPPSDGLVSDYDFQATYGTGDQSDVAQTVRVRTKYRSVS